MKKQPLYLSSCKSCSLKGVAVVRITPDELTAKFKFGQNLKEEGRAGVTRGLTERGGARDAETLEMMKKYCPYHS